MPRRSIFNNSRLTFSIPTAGSINPSTGFWEEGTPQSVVVTGDLQPYVRTGSSQEALPEGFKLADSKFFITDQVLPTVDDAELSFAATTIINDRTYYVAVRFDFSNGPLSTDTNFYILALKKLTGLPNGS